ncbi:non-ribosomal peptide synthetase [Streptomyces pactum]|uniref:Non-ribosomal peptide synthase n=1 Tax=Streptomyces pactum TaxID=68249 RepID=A0A1S6J5Q9_9ACTN|nr:non-ribosomal peptide synthetase [Streptomyces pactum]AQS67076.1 non-ribosomal peptide synthase [Streptomyces pactum]
MTSQYGTAPQGDTHTPSVTDTVTSVWASVLRIDTPDPDANFFALGGNSLQGARMVGRLREELGIRIPLSALFESQTAAELAARIEDLRGDDAPLTGPSVPAFAERTDGTFQAPASFAQQRLWVEEHILGPSSRYNVPAAVEIEGDLDVAALRLALRTLVDRHEPFRTTIRAVGGVPHQVVEAAMELPLEIIDLQGEPEEQREQVLVDRIGASAQRPFDVERGPLLRAELYRLADQWHVLLVNMHHAITDIHSFELAVAELLELYASAAKGTVPAADPPALQYADFAAWQRRTVGDAAFDAQLEYWKERLRGPLPVLDLPTDLTPQGSPSGRGATVAVELPRAVSRRVRELARQNDATPFMTVLTLLAALLHRYSGQTDIVVGTPSANRDLPELEGMLGYFLNTLAVRCDLSGDPTVLGLLGEVRERTLGAYAHQDVPFERVVNAVATDRSGLQSLFRVMLAFQQEMPSPELPGLTVTDVDLDRNAAKFDLVFSVTETETTYRVALEYNTDLFVEDKAWRILDHFRTLAADAVAAPTKRLSGLRVLPADEQRQIESWSAARCGPYPTDTFLHHMFEEQARRTPDAVAVESGDTEVTYRELDRRADLLAAALAERGVSTDHLVGLCAAPSVDLLTGILGILKAGAAYVPIDPLAPEDRMTHMVEDSGLRVLVTTAELHPLLPGGALDGVDVVHAEAEGPVDADGGTAPAPAGARPDPAVDPAQLVYLMYTSGTTGRPKGVGLPHTAVTPWMRWAQDVRPIGEGTRVVHNLSYHFDWSVEQMFHALTAGARLVMLPLEVRADPEATARFVDDHDIHMLYLTPTQMRALTGTGVTLPTLRHVSLGGENLSGDLVARIREVVSPGCLIWNEYGPTETAGVALAGRMGHASRDRASMPLGELVSNASCAVVDRWGNQQPIGVPGELLVGGDGVARGYRNRPELTAERFAPDPARPGRRLYRTGDMVRWLPDGEMEFLGRTDHQVKIRGVRVELEEIESVLRGHPGVADAVVVLEPGERLVAYLVPAPEGGPDDPELRSYLAPKLPAVMQPALLVRLDTMPTSATGKVDRARLPRPTDQPPAEVVVVPPSTETEHAVAAVWSEVLKLDVVDVNTTFFELGGDSLTLLAVVERLRRSQDLEIPVRAVVDTPTVAGLAARIDTLRWTLRSRETAVDTTGARELGEL